MKITKTYLKEIIKEELQILKKADKNVNENVFQDLKNKLFNKKAPNKTSTKTQNPQSEKGGDFKKMIEAALDRAAEAYYNTQDPRTYKKAEAAAAKGIATASQEIPGFSDFKKLFSDEVVKSEIRSFPQRYSMFSSDMFNKTPQEAVEFVFNTGSQQLHSRLRGSEQEYERRKGEERKSAWSNRWD
jgi:hypothetical protein